MKRQSVLLLLVACGEFAFAAGATGSAAAKEAETRYAADKKLCAEEATSSARMQCLRDAKAEYTKAVAAAKQERAKEGKASASAAACADCGKVVSVAVGEKKGEGGALGIIGGGVAGAVLGHQIGGGTGKDLATIAGAAGGAYAGHKVEEKMRSSKVWTVKVRLDGGEERSFAFDHDPGFASGDAVKVSGNTIVRK